MTEKNLSFINDEEKMYDFVRMDREDFLNFYSYLTEEEYDATLNDYRKYSNDAVDVANNFYDWLIDLEYASKEDKEEDLAYMVEDFTDMKIHIPRVFNLLRDISDRQK